jgi:amino acid transporter
MTGEKLAPPRAVGFWGTSLFQINGMIGSGIYALPALLVAAVGSFAPVMLLIAGIIFLPLVLVFAWLAARYDGSGGPVLYGKDAFGDFAGFQAGWCRFAAGIVALAANTHVMIAYFATLIPALGTPAVANVAMIGFFALLTMISVAGMRGSVFVLGAMTVLKLAPLAVILIAAAFGGFTGQPLALPQFGEAESILLLLFYGFTGFETVTLPAGEYRDPKRDIPRVLLTVLAGVTVIYALVIWAYLVIDPPAGATDNPMAAAAETALGPWGTLLIVIAAGASIAANNFGSVVVVPRIPYGMAEQGMLPRWFEQVSPRFKTPANAIVFYGVGSGIMAVAGGFTLLATASTLSRMLTYVITAAALPVLEWREGIRNSVHMIVATLAIAISVWIACQAEMRAWAVFAGLVGLGTVLYFLATRRRQGPTET